MNSHGGPGDIVGGASDCGCGGCGPHSGPPTPADVYNPPGLSALRYRAGTHGQFMASMRERIASRPALAALRTREPDDPAIALLDCWAVVADILTFYTERHAQEGFVATAGEQESLVLLGRLVGHRPRPALGAGGHLAYTLDPGARSTVPAGTQARSVPSPGQLPQTFETAEDLDADAQWNTLAVRLTAPPPLSPYSSRDGGPEPVTFTGAALNLRAGDRILVLFAAGQTPQVRTVADVTPDFTLGRTTVTFLREAPPDLPARAHSALSSAERAAPRRAAVEPLRAALEEARDLLTPETDPDDLYEALAQADRLVAEGIAFLPEVRDGVLARWADREVARAVRAVRAALVAVAADRRRSLPDIEYLRELARSLVCPASHEDRSAGDEECDRATALVATAAVLPALRRTPARLPASGREVGTSLGALWDPRSDAVPGLLAAADPRLAGSIHRAWATQRIAAPRQTSGIQVLRIKGRPLAGPRTGDGSETENIYLEGAHDGVLPGMHVVTEQARDDGSSPQVFVVEVVTTAQVRLPVPTPEDAPPITVPVTRITVDGAWYEDHDGRVPYESITVRTGGDPLVLAEQPVTEDVAGSRIELAQVHAGLRPGRRLIVSGERTDIPGTTGVTAAEPVMLAAVRQSLGADGPGESVRTTLLLAAPLAYTYRRDTVVIHGNVVPATQGETRTEVLGSGDAARARQSFPLRQVSASAPLTHLPAATADGAEPALTVRVDQVRWHLSEDLSLLGPQDHGHRLTERPGTASVAFGDGIHGSRLPTGLENVTATYRTGAGAGGNLPAGRITQLAGRPPGVNAVTNPLPSTGGTDADGPEDIRAGVPLRCRALDRLVSVQDYADFARARPGIGRATAARLFDGRRELVHLTVAGVDDAPIDVSDPLLSGLTTALAAYGDPHLPVTVDVRERVVLVLSAGLRVLPDHTFDTVETAVRAALLRTLGFAARDLARPAHLSEVLATAQAVPGVDHLDVDVFAGIPATGDPLALVRLPASLREAADAVDARPARALRTFHTVGQDATGSDDTLTSIALAHGLSVAELVALNPTLRAVGLRQGRRLTVFSGIRPAQLAVFAPDLPETLILRRIP
ncbi:putative baseplate assembly protein [Streptomyces sp. R44]|uniref:Baseplate assembly protein n=1 Tax=Streptomyces sp. R44 TaxID=3238633 RepID=A0AB39T8T5_9ACTN